MRVLVRAGLVLAFSVSVTVWFLLATLLTGAVPDAGVVAAGGLALLVLALVSGLPKRSVLADANRSELSVAAIAGVLMVFVAPLLVLANRYSDAPPGTEVLFFTAAAWGVLSLCAALVAKQTPWRPGYAALSAAALLGSAALLANWERPSSFSPMMRYSRQEVAFLFAGLAWAVGSVLLVRAKRSLGPALSRSVAGVTGGAVAVVYALVTQPWDTLVGPDAATAAAAGLAFAVAAIAWVVLTGSLGVGRASFAWFLPPVLMTALGVVEQGLRPRGPDPVIRPGALAGIALIAGALTLAWGLIGEDIAARSRARAATAALSFASVVAVAAVGTLWLPAMRASVSARLESGEPYSVRWVLVGFETAGGWLPVVVALLVLAGAWLALRGAPRSWVIALGAAAIPAAALYPLLASTPLHTWNTWLPISVQAEFGTEYVSLSFATLHDPIRLLALLAGVVAAAFLLLVEGMHKRGSQGSGPSEVS